jgi:Ca2+-binding RTX toxin-like protein
LGTFAHQPKPFASRDDIISGELNSLYFGPTVRYYSNGFETPLATNDRDWKTVQDSSDIAAWSKYIDFYDSGRLDFRSGLFDDDSRWFVDWDQTNAYGWAAKTTYTTARSRLEAVLVVNDDGSKAVHKNDALRDQAWSTQDASYASNGLLDYREVIYDDGSRIVDDLDPLNFTALKARKLIDDTDGSVATSVLRYDDGRVSTIHWGAASQVDGTSASETVNGTADPDLIRSGSGHDSLIGGLGADHMQGAGGNDAYYVDDAGDTVVEAVGSGVDAVNASVSYALPDHVENLYLLPGAFRGAGNAGNNYIAGHNGANRLDGLGGNDTLLGRAGNDTLVGGDGRDQLEGGAGVDTLFGNGGSDTFLWRDITHTGPTSSSADLVMDFSFQAGDRLHLALMDAVSGGSDQAFSFIGTAAFTSAGQIRYLQTSSETRLLLNTDSDSRAEGIIRIDGLAIPDTAWFIM